MKDWRPQRQAINLMLKYREGIDVQGTCVSSEVPLVRIPEYYLGTHPSTGNDIELFNWGISGPDTDPHSPQYPVLVLNPAPPPVPQDYRYFSSATVEKCRMAILLRTPTPAEQRMFSKDQLVQTVELLVASRYASNYVIFQRTGYKESYAVVQ